MARRTHSLTLLSLLTVAVAGAACSHGSDAPEKTDPKTVTPADKNPKTPEAPLPKPTIAASAKGIQPFLTSGGVSYLVPKKSWWVGLDYSCMTEMEASNPGGATALQMFQAQNPEVFTKLRELGVDVAKDLHAVGGYDCGGEMCIYAALHLTQPDAILHVLDVVPNHGKLDQIDPTHAAATLALPGGVTRHLHLRVTPIDWSAVPAGRSARVDAQRAATHIILFYGVNDAKPVPDPFADLAAPADAVARVQAVEQLATPALGRCLIGDAGDVHEDSFSDMKLRGAQFVVTAPPTLADDHAAHALGFGVSFAVEVALRVEGTPSQADAARWVAAGRAFAKQSMAPVMPMFQSMLGAYAGSMTALVEAAFAYHVDGNVLRLSFGTHNISETALRDLHIQ